MRKNDPNFNDNNTLDIQIAIILKYVEIKMKTF